MIQSMAGRIGHTIVQHKKRTTEEYIILSISGTFALGILPFFFIRAFQTDWAMAALDLFAVSASAGVFIYVYQTRQIQFARWVLAFLCVLIVVLTVVIKGSQQIVWIYPASVGIFYLLSPKIAASINFAMAFSLGPLIWNELDGIAVAQYSLSILVTLMFSYAFADRMRQQQSKLLELSTKDALTGAGNRRAMEEKLRETVELRRRYKETPAALILLDLDEFKKVNDQHGHTIGDEILIHFVEIICTRLRHTDKLYRFGGEEFVIIADNTDVHSVSILAEKLREAIDKASFPAQLHVTVSLGVAQHKDEETGLEWFGRADKAMFKAKDAGRNVCCVAA